MECSFLIGKKQIKNNNEIGWGGRWKWINFQMFKWNNLSELCKKCVRIGVCVKTKKAKECVRTHELGTNRNEAAESGLYWAITTR